MILEIALLDRPKTFKRKLFNRCKSRASDLLLGNKSASFMDLRAEEISCTEYILDNIDKTNYEKISKRARARGLIEASSCHVIKTDSDDGPGYGLKIGSHVYDIPENLAKAIINHT